MEEKRKRRKIDLNGTRLMKATEINDIKFPYFSLLIWLTPCDCYTLQRGPSVASFYFTCILFLKNASNEGSTILPSFSKMKLRPNEDLFPRALQSMPSVRNEKINVFETLLIFDQHIVSFFVDK